MAWAAVVAGRRWRWGRSCRQWQEGAGQQQVSAAQPVERGAVLVVSGLQAVKYGLVASAVAGVQLACWIAVAWSRALQRGVQRCTGPAGCMSAIFASANPVGSPCASAPSARADRTGISLETCGAGQDSRGQQPLLASQ